MIIQVTGNHSAKCLLYTAFFFTKCISWNTKNVRVKNGKLIIEALKEEFYGTKYTSSRIKTKKSWKYGRFEIRAKLPKGVGTWAAFWGLPTEWKHGNWPNSGEIDVLEHVGFEEGHIVSSVHNIAHHGNLSNSDQTKYVVADNVVTSFNDYVLEEMKKENVEKELIDQYFAANPPYMSVSGLKRYWDKYGK